MKIVTKVLLKEIFRHVKGILGALEKWVDGYPEA